MLKYFGWFFLVMNLAIFDFLLFRFLDVGLAFIIYNIFALSIGITLAVLSFKIKKTNLLFAELTYVVGFSMVVIHFTKLVVRTCI